MSEFTYERKDTKCELDTFELDNVWIDHAPRQYISSRVLYIGDSISCGTRRVEKLATGEKFLFACGQKAEFVA